MLNRITVVLWKWRSNGNWKKYSAGHVNAIVAMVDAHLDLPCDYVLITDDPIGVDPAVRCLPLEKVAANLPMVRAPQRNAYRRIGLFNAAMRDVLGKRLLQLDLDTVIIKNITGMVDRPEPFVIWKSPSIGPTGYALNPSFMLMTAGAQRQVYDRYVVDPVGVASAAKLAGFTSTDQAVISHLATSDAVTIDETDGMVSFRDHLQRGALKPDAAVKVVSFMDRFDPADPLLQDRCPWIARHYPYRSAAVAA